MELITAITIAYIVTVATVALVATVVVLRDIAKSKQDQPVQTIQLVAPNPVASTEEASETKVEEPIEEPVPEEQEGDVTFSTEKRTLDEKYLELSSEYKGYYDELVRYAMSFEGNKRYKTANYEEYKVFRRRLVKIKIKRGIIVCELLVPNLDFKNFISENKVDAKQQSTVINVTDEQSLEAVKGCIAIAYQEIEEELAYKKEQARIRRLEKRKEARLLEKGANESEETVATDESLDETLEETKDVAEDVLEETAVVTPDSDEESLDIEVENTENDQPSDESELTKEDVDTVESKDLSDEVDATADDNELTEEMVSNKNEPIEENETKEEELVEDSNPTDESEEKREETVEAESENSEEMN